MSSSQTLKGVGADRHVKGMYSGSGASLPGKDTGEGRSSDDWHQQIVMGQQQGLTPGSLHLTMKDHLRGRDYCTVGDAGRTWP